MITHSIRAKSQQTATIGSDLIRSSAWNAIRLASAMISGVLVTAMLARHLGTLGMGAFSYAIWLVGTVVFAGNCGLPTTATRYIAECIGAGQLRQAQAVTRRIIGDQFRISLVACSVGLVLLLSLHVAPGVLAPMALTFMIGLRLLQETSTAILLGKQQFNRAAAASVADAVCKISFVAIGIYVLRLSLPSLYIALSVAAMLSTIVSFQLTDPRSWWITTAGVEVGRDLQKRIRKFSVLAAYSLLLNAIVWQRSEVFFLKHLSDLSQIGIYAAAFSLASVLKAVPGVVSDSLLAMASRSHGGNAEDFRSLYRSGVLVVFALALPVAALGVMLAGPITRLLYGPSFSAAVPMAQVLIASSIVTSLGGVGWAVMYASERQGFDVICGTAVAILDVGLAILLIPQYGAMGATAANSAAQITAILLTLVYLVHHLKLDLPYGAMSRIATAALLIIAPAGMLRYLAWSPMWTFGIAVAGIPLYAWLLQRFGVVAQSTYRDTVGNLAALRFALQSQEDFVQP